MPITLDSVLAQAKALSQKKPAQTIRIRLTFNGESYLIKFNNGQQLPELEATE
jgi:hypothetical protein